MVESHRHTCNAMTKLSPSLGPRVLLRVAPSAGFGFVVVNCCHFLCCHTVFSVTPGAIQLNPQQALSSSVPLISSAYLPSAPHRPWWTQRYCGGLRWCIAGALGLDCRCHIDVFTSLCCNGGQCIGVEQKPCKCRGQHAVSYVESLRGIHRGRATGTCTIDLM